VVVAAREEPLLLELLEPAVDGGALLGELGGERLVLGGKLLERLEVVDIGLERPVALQPPLQRGVFGRDPRGAPLVVPKAGRLHLLLERFGALG
jgi:hypothetical protein